METSRRVRKTTLRRLQRQVDFSHPEPIEEKEEEKPVVKTGFGKQGMTRPIRVPERDHIRGPVDGG